MVEVEPRVRDAKHGAQDGQIASTATNHQGKGEAKDIKTFVAYSDLEWGGTEDRRSITN